MSRLLSTSDMERKSDKVRRLVAGRDYKSALRIAKDFRLGIRIEEWKQMTRAFECMNYPEFYQSIGLDPKAEIRKGIEILCRIYGKESKCTG